jgi:hypothetical protein
MAPFVWIPGEAEALVLLFEAPFLFNLALCRREENAS